MTGPQVGTERRRGDSPGCGGFDALGQLRRADFLPGHHRVEMRVGAKLQQAGGIQPTQQLGKREGEKRADIGHGTLDSMPSKGRVKALMPYFQTGQIPHSGGMTNIWPQRDLYRIHLEEFLEKTGMTQELFCDEVNKRAKVYEEAGKKVHLSLSHLRNALYRKNKRLGLEILQISSAIFNISVMNYIDDPGAPIAGQDMSEESEEDRFFARMLIKGARPKDLNSEQKQYVIEDVFRTVARIHALATPGMGQPRENPPRVQPDTQPGAGGGGPHRAPRLKK